MSNKSQRKYKGFEGIAISDMQTVSVAEDLCLFLYTFSGNSALQSILNHYSAT